MTKQQRAELSKMGEIVQKRLTISDDELEKKKGEPDWDVEEAKRQIELSKRIISLITEAKQNYKGLKDAYLRSLTLLDEYKVPHLQ